MEASNTGQDEGQGVEGEDQYDPAARAEGDDPEAVEGDQGEQVASDAPNELGQSTPVATSAPDPASQSGVPLAEDREAGVQPGPVNPGDDSDEDRPEGADPTSPSAAQPSE